MCLWQRAKLFYLNRLEEFFEKMGLHYIIFIEIQSLAYYSGPKNFCWFEIFDGLEGCFTLAHSIILKLKVVNIISLS